MTTKTLTTFVFICDSERCPDRSTVGPGDRGGRTLTLPRGEWAGGDGTAMNPGEWIGSLEDARQYARRRGWILGSTTRCSDCAVGR